jgi:hypothetical protein
MYPAVRRLRVLPASGLGANLRRGLVFALFAIRCQVLHQRRSTVNRRGYFLQQYERFRRPRSKLRPMLVHVPKQFAAFGVIAAHASQIHRELPGDRPAKSILPGSANFMHTPARESASDVHSELACLVMNFEGCHVSFPASSEFDYEKP